MTNFMSSVALFFDLAHLWFLIKNNVFFPYPDAAKSNDVFEGKLSMPANNFVSKPIKVAYSPL
jgi:hypothetical protein